MIQVDNICKSFGQKTLFDHLDIHIAPGETALLKAPSGSGKTTLIRMLMGFDKADSGTILIDGETMNRHTLKSIRRKIAYVSQDADLHLTSIKEMLETVFTYKANRHIEDYEQSFKSYCREFYLEEDIYHKEVKNLSGGERQRVALIIALLLDRPILILDEVTSGLDTDLKTLIKDKVAAMNKTVLVISHDEIWQSLESMKAVSLV